MKLFLTCAGLLPVAAGVLAFRVTGPAESGQIATIIGFGAVLAWAAWISAVALYCLWQ